MTSCVLPNVRNTVGYSPLQAWHQIRHALGHETNVPPRWLLSPAAEVRRSLWQPNAMDTLPPLSDQEQYSIMAQQCTDVEMDFCPSPPVYSQYTAPTSCQAAMMQYMTPTAQPQLVSQAQNTTQALFPFTANPNAHRNKKKQRCF